MTWGQTERGARAKQGRVGSLGVAMSAWLCHEDVAVGNLGPAAGLWWVTQQLIGLNLPLLLMVAALQVDMWASGADYV